MKRVLAGTMLVAATTLLVAGCTAPRSADLPAVSAPSAKSAHASQSSQAEQTARGALIGALASCGLSPDDEGVALGSTGGLVLQSQPRGRPTNVDPATTRCALTALGLPPSDAALLDATTATGGYQTLQWRRYSASVNVEDTLDFEVDVFVNAG